MIIRDATDEDWPRIGSFFAAIVRAGTTHAYPEDLSAAEAQALWMAEPPVPGAFNRRGYGYVGLHVMFQSFPAG